MIALKIIRKDGSTQTVIVPPDPAGNLLARCREIIRKVKAEDRTPPPEDDGPPTAA